MNTKQRILSISIDQFNDLGYHQVTLADIAKACEMSRGNLAYHYKNKVHILNDLVVRMVKEVRAIQDQRKGFPAFTNLTLDVRTCRILQRRYKFIFRDSSVLEHKHIRRVMNIWSEVSILRNNEAFAFGVSIGNLKPELFNGMYAQLSINAWMVAYYWVSQQSVREVKKTEEAEKMIWATIIPHFTEKGLLAFEEFYGKAYLTKMGKPINKLVKPNLLF
jgi:AcrR family transcriptional regulator